MSDSHGKEFTGTPLVILNLLRAHPEGLTIVQIRELGAIEGHQHLDRRVRDLDPHFEIERTKAGKLTVYRLLGKRKDDAYDYGTISKKLRAKILTRDGRRCRMCGKTVDEDSVKLHIDHKIPRTWGGVTAEENLWTLCSGCNEGKRDYFATFDPKQMEGILEHESVHRRLVELLHSRQDEWVDSDLLEFVANFDDYQADWQKRLRELRYFGLVIDTKNIKAGKRTLSRYKLTNWLDLPENLSEAARRFEAERAKKNKKPKEAD